MVYKQQTAELSQSSLETGRKKEPEAASIWKQVSSNNTNKTLVYLCYVTMTRGSPLRPRYCAAVALGGTATLASGLVARWTVGGTAGR